jgi:DNA gyrase/topoisomerase IV subunit A
MQTENVKKVLEGLLAGLEGGKVEETIPQEERDKLEEEKERLEKELEELENRKSEVKGKLKEIDSVLNQSAKKERQVLQKLAVVAGTIGVSLKDLGIELPEVKKSASGKVNNLVVYVNGKRWHDIPSLALWKYSVGCGGSASDGRLKMSEFVELIEKKGYKYEEGGWRIVLEGKKGRIVVEGKIEEKTE